MSPFSFTVTDLRRRSKGYQLAAGHRLRELLARESFAKFLSIVLGRNTRMQRTGGASGFNLHADPNDANLIHGILRLDQWSENSHQLREWQ